MKLREIQLRLERLYGLDLGASVEDFVCDEEAAREAVGDKVSRREILLVAEEPDGIAVGLYVDEVALERLRGARDAWMDDGRFDAACLATEGVSHFVYLLFRANGDNQVSQLELELQAEVDKYATGLLAGNGVALIRERSRSLRRRLFAEAELLDELDPEEVERYQTALRAAARYTARLEERFVARGDLRGLARELRRFYRLGASDKLSSAD